MQKIMLPVQMPEKNTTTLETIETLKINQSDCSTTWINWSKSSFLCKETCKIFLLQFLHSSQPFIASQPSFFLQLPHCQAQNGYGHLHHLWSAPRWRKVRRGQHIRPHEVAHPPVSEVHIRAHLGTSQQALSHLEIKSYPPWNFMTHRNAPLSVL